MTRFMRHLETVSRTQLSPTESSKPTLLKVSASLKQLTSLTLNIQFTAKLIRYQPSLLEGGGSWLEIQDVLIDHVRSWLQEYSSPVVHVSSQVRSLGTFIQALIPNIQGNVAAEDYGTASRAIQNVVTELQRVSRLFGETRMLAVQFIEESRRVQKKFRWNLDSVRAKLMTDQAQLRALEEQETILATQLTKVLDASMQASTKQILHFKDCGLILGATIPVGSIQFAASEGAILMERSQERSQLRDRESQ